MWRPTVWHRGPDVIIELGGEDAKILFLTNGMEVRDERLLRRGHRGLHRPDGHAAENGRGGDGQSRPDSGKDLHHRRRCGVFAKSDIQPLINQGAKSADIAKSIYQAVVNQTIAGLAQGRPIKGHVLYLGGPLTFSKCLRPELRRDFGRHRNLPGE